MWKGGGVTWMWRCPPCCSWSPRLRGGKGNKEGCRGGVGVVAWKGRFSGKEHGVHVAGGERQGSWEAWSLETAGQGVPVVAQQ